MYVIIACFLNMIESQIKSGVSAILTAALGFTSGCSGGSGKYLYDIQMCADALNGGVPDGYCNTPGDEPIKYNGPLTIYLSDGNIMQLDPDQDGSYHKEFDLNEPQPDGTVIPAILYSNGIRVCSSQAIETNGLNSKTLHLPYTAESCALYPVPLFPIINEVHT